MPRPDMLPLADAARPMPRPPAPLPPERPDEEVTGTAETAPERPGSTDGERPPRRPVPEIDPRLSARATGAGQAARAQRAAARRAVGRLWLAETGPLCGDPGIRGERVAPVTGEGACGIDRPVRAERIAGVALEPAPTLACPMIRALAGWLKEGAIPAFAAEGAPLAGIGVAAGYVCRNVNYDPEADVSEHALGLAIDVARFEREDGAVVTVLEGWGSEAHGALLAEVHEAACGIFGTALGPESDRHHQDHFHYDAAERRRAYCP